MGQGNDTGARGYAIDELIDNGEGNIVVDLAEVSAVDSTIVGFLFSRARRLRKLEGALKLCSPPHAVRDSLEVMGVSDFIPVFEDRVGALLASPPEVRQRLGIQDRRKSGDRRKVRIPVEWEDRREGERRQKSLW